MEVRLKLSVKVLSQIAIFSQNPILAAINSIKNVIQLFIKFSYKISRHLKE